MFQGRFHFLAKPSRSTPYYNTSGSGADDTSPVQEALKEEMKDELKNATFESTTLMDNLFPAPQQIIDKVSKQLKNFDSVLRKADRRLAERSVYEPFASLLNTIHDKTMDQLQMSTHNDNLCFSIYDREMAEGLDGAAPLKPDVIGTNRVILPGEKIKWTDSYQMVPVEVKGDWLQLVAQAATYARCIFATGRRLFVLVIALRHTTREVRFLFFHRSGLSSTTPAKLTTDEGWNRFISAVVGITACPNAHAAGLLGFSIPLDRSLCPIGRTLHARHCIRGRATHIFEISLPNHVTFIVKESWPLRSRATEHEMFHQVSGRFGIPQIYKVEEIQGPDETPLGLQLYPADLKYWHLFKENIASDEEPEPEQRAFIRLIFQDKAHSLKSAHSPHELVKAIAHAMVGTSTPPLLLHAPKLLCRLSQPISGWVVTL